MAVQFILGRSGTGKTSRCVRSIVDALLEEGGEQRLLLLVPEQASYQAERAILSDDRIAGYSRLSVVSFERLGYLVSGRNAAGGVLSKIGRQMVVQRIMREQRGKLGVLGPSAGRCGLGREMAEAISELHQYLKMPEDVERLAEQLGKEGKSKITSLKFADIGLIFREYLNFVEGKFIDPDIELMRLCGAVAESELVKGARLWVDGFAGFTTTELAILRELLRAVSDAHIALCLDAEALDLNNAEPGKVDAFGLFGRTERTYSSILEIIRSCKLQLAEPVILEEAVRFRESPQLAHLERSLFGDSDGSKCCDVGDKIRIVSAASKRAEVQYVGRQIARLVRERGYRYRDIAVIASDIEGYEPHIRAYFEDYRIPFFIDKRRSLSQHAVVVLINSAFGAVLGGFSHSDVFSFLKNSLVPMERGEIDLLENYCVAYGVNEKDWQSEQLWEFQGKSEKCFGQEEVNDIRRRAVGPLLKFRERLFAEEMVSAYEFTQIVFDFLEGLGVRERIGGWIEEALSNGETAAAEEQRQFYSRFIDVFDELVGVFGEERLSVEDYFAIVCDSFSQMTLAFIPPGLDEVLVGSIERSRHPDLKAVFLLGATQGDFPVPVGYKGVLSDADRTAAEGKDFELGGGVSQLLAERQYLAYIAFTRASEFLCISYPVKDEKGGVEVRSQFVNNVQSLFEGLCEEPAAVEGKDIGEVYSEAELADLLASGLGKDARGERSGHLAEQLEGLLNEVCRDEQLGEAGLNVKAAVEYNNEAKLDKKIVGVLFGERINGSATRLGTFAACPYQYFAKYVLGLEERKEFKFEPLDLGAFYHSVLDMFIKEFNRSGKDFASVSDEELVELAREQVSRLVREDSFICNFANHRRHNSYIIHSAGEILEDCVKAIGRMVRAGNFRPVGSEVWFGEARGAEERLGEYKAGLSKNRRLYLRGKIDRLDIAQAGGKGAALIFDYKRREKSFRWSEFYHGLDMQLAIYILAAGKGGKGRYKVDEVAGAFYMPVEVSPEAGKWGKEAESGEKFGYKAKGVFDGRFADELARDGSPGWNKFYSFYVSSKGDQYGNYRTSSALRSEDFEKMLRFAEGKIVELGEGIVSGRIEIRPYRLGGSSPCSWCKYKSVCRFDWQINNYNSLGSVGKKEFFEGVCCG